MEQKENNQALVITKESSNQLYQSSSRSDGQ